MSATTIALLLADSRTPSGGYAHSGGLEAALAAGDVDVPAFIAARLETVAATEAAFAAAAGRAETAEDLFELEDELAARTPSEPLRAASRQLGRSLLRLASRLWPWEESLPEDPLRRYAESSRATPRPLILGAVGRRAGLDRIDVARLSLYEDVATVAAAAVKLLLLDPLDASAWTAGLAPRIEILATRAAAPDAGLPAVAVPLLDLRSLDHANSERKLFVT